MMPEEVVWLVSVESVEWRRDAWEVHVRVREGVYELNDYPVRITHLARTNSQALRAALADVVRWLVQEHMRRGAVPPHAMVLDWGRVRRVAEKSPPDIRGAIENLETAGLSGIGHGVSNQF